MDRRSIPGGPADAGGLRASAARTAADQVSLRADASDPERRALACDRSGENRTTSPTRNPRFSASCLEIKIDGGVDASRDCVDAGTTAAASEPIRSRHPRARFIPQSTICPDALRNGVPEPPRASAVQIRTQAFVAKLAVQVALSDKPLRTRCTFRSVAGVVPTGS